METQMVNSEYKSRPVVGARNRFYISSGKKNAQYTLRVRFEEWTPGGMATRDQYICNLGIDLERAKAKAELEAGEPVLVKSFDLNPYGEETEEEKALRLARENQRVMAEERQAKYDAEAAEKMRIRREEDAKSQWQGSVGERITRKLTCLRWIPTYEGAYGMRYVAIFRDVDMNKYVFFGGYAKSLPGDGETWEVSFSVDSHGERDGCKQTIIKRPSKAKGA